MHTYHLSSPLIGYLRVRFNYFAIILDLSYSHLDITHYTVYIFHILLFEKCYLVYVLLSFSSLSYEPYFTVGH